MLRLRSLSPDPTTARHKSLYISNSKLRVSALISVNYELAETWCHSIPLRSSRLCGVSPVFSRTPQRRNGLRGNGECDRARVLSIFTCRVVDNSCATGGLSASVVFQVSREIALADKPPVAHNLSIEDRRNTRLRSKQSTGQLPRPCSFWPLTFSPHVRRSTRGHPGLAHTFDRSRLLCAAKPFDCSGQAVRIGLSTRIGPESLSRG